MTEKKRLFDFEKFNRLQAQNHAINELESWMKNREAIFDFIDSSIRASLKEFAEKVRPPQQDPAVDQWSTGWVCCADDVNEKIDSLLCDYGIEMGKEKSR